MEHTYLFALGMMTWEGRLRDWGWGHRLISYNSFGSFQAYLWSRQILSYYFSLFLCVRLSFFLRSQCTIIRIDDLSQEDPFRVKLIILGWNYPRTFPTRKLTLRRRANTRKVVEVFSSIKLREFLRCFSDNTYKPITQMTEQESHFNQLRILYWVATKC